MYLSIVNILYCRVADEDSPYNKVCLCYILGERLVSYLECGFTFPFCVVIFLVDNTVNMVTELGYG